MKGLSNGEAAFEQILAAYQLLLQKQRTIISQAADLGDEGTVSLLSDYVSQQEKEVWMYAAQQGRRV